MKVTYDILFSLKITHDYFSDKVFEDFEIIANKATNVLIKEFRLFSKKTGNTWNLFFQSEGPFATTPLALINKEFLFTLKIKDSSFYAITNETYLNGKDEMLYFNSPLDAVLTPEKRKVYPLKFNYVIHHLARPVNLKVTNSKGTEIINEVISDEDKRRTGIDLTVHGENVYTISEDSIPPNSLENEEIFSKEGNDDDPFYGAIYFKVLPANDDVVSKEYQINFETNND